MAKLWQLNRAAFGNLVAAMTLPPQNVSRG
jgi:hypothetical protein